MSSSGPLTVIALGGNAIARRGDDGTITAQYERAYQALARVAKLVCSDTRVVLTHGNGPVVGNIVLRGEIAQNSVPPTPLYIAGADSEGGIGLMLQQVLGNQLRAAGSACLPATIVTQVVVSSDDPAFAHPTKPIGPTYPSHDAAVMAARADWSIAEQPDGSWRRVVASPRPLEIIEAEAVSALLEAGLVPIAAGGGGVPVTRGANGVLNGCDAVVDKDWSSAILARQLDADLLVILMEANAVYRDWGTQLQSAIGTISPHDAAELAATLPAGSIGPKLAAAAWFASGGGRAVIGRAEDLDALVSGRTGTRVEQPGAHLQ